MVAFSWQVFYKDKDHHVHLLVKAHPTVSPNQIVGRLKQFSTYDQWLRNYDYMIKFFVMKNISCGQEDIFAPQLEKSVNKLEKSVNKRSKNILKNRVDVKRFISHTKGCDVSRLKNSKHGVKVNSLKSFLLDDVPEVKHALSILTSKDRMYKLLSQMKDGSSFTVNNRFSCQLNNGKDGTGEVFSSAKQDVNCPRTSQEASVLVYDKKTGEDLDGLVVLNYDKDLASSYNVMLYVKHHGQSQWEFGTEAVAMLDVKAQM